MADISPPDENDSRSTMRRRFVWLLYGVTALWGIGQVVVPNSGSLYWIVSVLLGVAATCWVVEDMRIRGQRFYPVVPLIFFLVWPLASLGYLIWTRRFRGLGLWLLHLVGLIATVVIVFYPTVLLLYWLGVIDVTPDGTIQHLD
ncbi:hypothetical protein FF011L_36600 [Roseimaritima multifibrata]|uniref:Uncharacterized protein n=1 Tax=Roseimaritima multifibrata TaxID=1930274 RepID=A0A517MJ43_9BACT|nr:hypothetical protein [Roseimaritima multifibrata]QDS94878.1 hypothetical protein FF011L_36600 [Roseimaritima multifibrata]